MSSGSLKACRRATCASTRYSGNFRRSISALSRGPSRRANRRRSRRRISLVALALDASFLQRYAQARAAARQAPPRIDFVRIEPGSERYAEALHKLFDDQIGAPADPRALAKRVTSFYGGENFEGIDYRIVQDDDGQLWPCADAPGEIPGVRPTCASGSICRMILRATRTTTPRRASSNRKSRGPAANGYAICRSGRHRGSQPSCGCRFRRHLPTSSRRTRRSKPRIFISFKTSAASPNIACTRLSTAWISAGTSATGARFVRVSCAM